MSDIKYILFTGSMQPKNPMKATDDKLKELSRVGYRQGTDYDIVSLKVLEDMLGGKKFAHGGMMNMDEMIRPLGYAAGGPFPPEDNVLEKLKKNDPDKELRDKGILPPLQERQGIMAQPAGLMEDTENFMILGMKLQLLRAADSLAEMDRIEKLNPEEVIREFEIFMGEKGA